MLELRRIQDNPDELSDMLKRRRFKGVDADKLKQLIEDSKSVKSELDGKRSERNTESKLIGQLIGQGKKDEAEKKKAAVKKIGDAIDKLEAELGKLDEELTDIITGLPNWLDADVPDGADDSANKVLREVGAKPKFKFQPKPHWDLAEKNGLEFERGVKLAGARFYAYQGFAARLERAIINFMLDLHTREFGYTECWVPFLVNAESMFTTGQYPKFKGDFYELESDGLALIPTTEVPLVNLYRDEIIPEEELPIRVTGVSSCFRREAGAAGKDTRGLIRVHQFQKVELVQLAHPDKSQEAHEEMLGHAEEVLKRLGLHYRVVLLSSGDTGAAAYRTYDLEVWLPGLDRYQEISSVSNTLDFQSRRGKIRFRPPGNKAKPVLLHTLNGSGLAAGRTLVAILENYQQEDGTVAIPDVLKPYMGA